MPEYVDGTQARLREYVQDQLDAKARLIAAKDQLIAAQDQMIDALRVELDWWRQEVAALRQQLADQDAARKPNAAPNPPAG